MRTRAWPARLNTQIPAALARTPAPRPARGPAAGDRRCGPPSAAWRGPRCQAVGRLEAKAFHGGRTARNHLLCLADSNGISRSRVDEVLDLVGLVGAARRRAGGFSLGMAQRLGIAAALLG